MRLLGEVAVKTAWLILAGYALLCVLERPR